MQNISTYVCMYPCSFLIYITLYRRIKGVLNTKIANSTNNYRKIKQDSG